MQTRLPGDKLTLADLGQSLWKAADFTKLVSYLKGMGSTISVGTIEQGMAQL